MCTPYPVLALIVELWTDTNALSWSATPGPRFSEKAERSTSTVASPATRRPAAPLASLNLIPTMTTVPSPARGPSIVRAGWPSWALRTMVFVGPAPRRVAGFVTRRLSVHVPAPRQITAPGGARSSAAWISSPGRREIVHGTPSSSPGRAQETRRTATRPSATHRRIRVTSRMGGDCRNRHSPPPPRRPMSCRRIPTGPPHRRGPGYRQPVTGCASPAPSSPRVRPPASRTRS